MPVIKSAQKQVHVSERKRLRNKSTRSLVKTNIIKAEKAIFSGSKEAQIEVKTAISSLDKAAKKGIIPANNAARRKSRLMKRLNKVQPQSQGVDKKPTP